MKTDKNKFCYLDSFSGLVPAIALELIPPDGFNSARVRMRLTANRGAYRRGEIVETSILHAVPRKAVYTLRGCYGKGTRIGGYSWQEIFESEREANANRPT